MADLKSILMRKESFTHLILKLEELNIAEKYPSFTPVLNALKKRLHKVDTGTLSKGRPRNAATKKEYKRNLAQAAYHISCGVFSYAQITGNRALKNAIKYAVSDFYRPDDDTVIGRCRQVVNAAKKVQNPEYYGLSPLAFERYDAAFKQFNDFKNTPLIRIKKHAQALRHADKLLDQCLSIIQLQLDPLVVAVSQFEEKLSDQYNNVRRIKKSPGRKRKYIKKQKPESKPVAASVDTNQPITDAKEITVGMFALPVYNS